MTVLSLITQTFTYPSWSVDRLPSLVGKVAIVTGASAGLGKLTALELARKGAHVFCVGRSASKTQAVVDDIKAETGNDKVELLLADFMDLAAVEAAADAFLSRRLTLDILVNNAGVGPYPWEMTAIGTEARFTINHFSPVVFTMRLLPALQRARCARIVNMSSMAHMAAYSGIQYDRLNDRTAHAVRYGETKLAAIHFTRELQRRLEDAGITNILVNAVHPGAVRTAIFNPAHEAFWGSCLGAAVLWLMIPPEAGALTQIYVAADPEIERLQARGEYFVPYAAIGQPLAVATNDKAAGRTWEWTQEILRKHYRSDWSYGL